MADSTDAQVTNTEPEAQATNTEPEAQATSTEPEAQVTNTEPAAQATSTEQEVPATKPKETATGATASNNGSYKAVMIGATGAIGKYLFAELIKEKRFSTITAIGRRPATIPDDFEGAQDINLEEEVKSGRVQQINDLDLNKEINKETVGKHFEEKDIFFSAFGTTRKAAGSAAEFRRIDLGINYELAKVAKECNVPFYSLVSSQGANSESWFLYLQCKGELDNKATDLAFDKLAIWRPGMLNRGAQLRFTEKLAGLVMHKIPVQTVAKAMMNDALNRLTVNDEKTKGKKLFTNTEIYGLCGLDKNGKKKE